MTDTPGLKIEKEFAELEEFKDLEKIKATNDENKLEHWDWKINNIKYDVKSQKKVKRFDKNPSNEFTYVEFQTYNYKGWIYGKADKIAFEFCDSYIIVDRLDLLQLVISKMDTKEIFDRPMTYRFYKRTRKTSSDILVLVPIEDIVEISEKIIQKNETC